ncbi:MAG: hypothetical protein LBN10_04970 [Propionibacteriaceae bacterium]|nr:hypothetical protein [Propionibacteriaceae bacterium]
MEALARCGGRAVGTSQWEAGVLLVPVLAQAVLASSSSASAAALLLLGLGLAVVGVARRKKVEA